MQFGKSTRDGRNVVGPRWGSATFRVIKMRIGGDSDYPRWRHNRYVVNS